MCGRYEIEMLDREYIQHMRDVMKAAPKRRKDRFNVAPSQEAPILRWHDEKLQWNEVRWQLYEAWWKNMPFPVGPQINARSDKVFKINMYKHSMMKRRCLVLATGWYEWNRKRKSEPPRFIHMKDSRPILFGGIWTRYYNKETEVGNDNFAIITTDGHEKMKSFHDRMPVIINPRDYAKWLDPENHDEKWLKERLETYKGRDLEVIQVSKYVNNVRNQGKECIKPLAA